MTSLTQALHEIHPALPTAGGLFLLLALAFVAHFLARFVLQRAVQAFTRRTSATWDGAFAEEKFFAMTAVLLLVFRDTILGLVASVQLTAQDMVRVGDWIEMPRYNADGDVIDVALHTVTVQNWDKTITTIPTHALISDSFTNWRGMYGAGGRRIKRSVFIDVESIRFLTREEIERLRNFALLKGYIDAKQSELEEHNRRVAPGTSEAVNLRRLTNIGTFRAYVFNYVRSHPGINKDLTLMVRQLAPGAGGLPLEIYAFTSDTAWEAYENTQGDIFDHVLAVTGEFGLHLFQNPTGQDIRRAFPARQEA